MSNPSLSLVIPMFNEEDNAESVAVALQRELEQAGIPYELVLVDNGSTDNTGCILQALAKKSSTIKVITVPQNQGYGWGILNGLRWATGDYLGFMGGDGQIEPRDVIKVYQHQVAGQYQICKVRRVQREDGCLRRLISHIFNRIFVYTFKVNVGDINGSPKIMARQCYDHLILSSKDWFLDAEVIIKAQNMNFTIGEVPVIFRRRVGGCSSVRPRTVWEFLRNIATYRRRGVLYEGSDPMWGEGDTA